MSKSVESLYKYIQIFIYRYPKRVLFLEGAPSTSKFGRGLKTVESYTKPGVESPSYRGPCTSSTAITEPATRVQPLTIKAFRPWLLGNRSHCAITMSFTAHSSLMNHTHLVVLLCPTPERLAAMCSPTPNAICLGERLSRSTLL